MTVASPALLASTARHISPTEEIVTFPTSGGGSWKVWDRFLAIRGEHIFEIGNICATCEFWFRRLDGQAASVDVEALDHKLASGLTALEPDVVDAFASLLQAGTYRIALFCLMPFRVAVGSAADYFAQEQRVAWGEDDLPQDPDTDYYRVNGRSDVPVTAEGDLAYEFLAPLQSPDSLDPRRIAFFEERLSQGAAPTAVAVGVLDIKQYWDSPVAHWCLSHYLLDGHHKVEAAARTGRPLTLLSFIATEHGISQPEHLDQLLDGYGSGASVPYRDGLTCRQGSTLHRIP